MFFYLDIYFSVDELFCSFNLHKLNYCFVFSNSGINGPAPSQRSRKPARRPKNGLGVENEGANAVRIQGVSRYRGGPCTDGAR